MQTLLTHRHRGTAFRVRFANDLQRSSRTFALTRSSENGQYYRTQRLRARMERTAPPALGVHLIFTDFPDFSWLIRSPVANYSMNEVRNGFQVLKGDCHGPVPPHD